MTASTDRETVSAPRASKALDAMGCKPDEALAGTANLLDLVERSETATHADTAPGLRAGRHR